MIDEMKILVDGDGCPVKSIVEQRAKEKNICVLIFIDTSHLLISDYSQIVQVSKGVDSADFALISYANKGDLIVTGDYGVATMGLAKGCVVLNFNGKRYTNENIDQLLFERHLSKKMRKSGIRTGHIKKRTKDDDMHFSEALRRILCDVSE